MESMMNFSSKTLMLVAAACSLLVFGTGCSSQGEFRQATGAGVSLSENNYRIIKVGASGESSGFKLLGVVPIVSPTYAGAKRELYKSTGISFEGRSVALANQTEDRSNIYLILFSVPSITITADVVEFTGQSKNTNIRSISH